MRPDWSGEDAFDYLLGVAALDSGHAGDAIFSLQRLVARQPDFSGARLELARAYYDVGDNELARIEFARVQSENPPPNVAQTVSDYMAAIEIKSREYQASAQYYIELGGGYDSNAPASTDENIFLNFVLNPTNLEQSSAFAKVTLGGLWNNPISPSSQVLFNARVDHRANPSRILSMLRTLIWVLPGAGSQVKALPLSQLTRSSAHLMVNTTSEISV